MNKEVRVRFAPSPTGPLHIGGLRTALFNYLFAKKHGGKFILRIEDTDQSRYVEGTESYIKEVLAWCNIPYDEGPEKEGNHGPYRQSERRKFYRQYAEQLITSGNAYYAFDTPENLDFHRKDHEAKGKTFIYNWHNRLKLQNSLSLSQKEVQQRLQAGDAYVIRFKSPQDRQLLLKDIVRGQITIDTNILDDKILFKSDGMPTYHLANVVDDHLMQISHVIRGEEWLPSLALHYLLYDAFSWEKPVFAHLPLILKPTGKGKLSKRDGEKGGFPVFPISWKDATGYKEAGYFPEAVVNFLAFLGWNPGTEQELFTMEGLIAHFSLERVNTSGARFDPEKTNWYNHQWLQQKDNKELTRLFIPVLKRKGLTGSLITYEYVEQVISLIKERANFINDFWELGNYFFVSPTTYVEKARKKQWKEDTADIMQQVAVVLQSIDDFSSLNVETIIKNWIGEQEFSFRKVMPPLRLSVVGDLKGPHLFDIMALIGKQECLKRIKHAISVL